MRNELFFKGLVLLAVGGVFMLLGLLTGTSETGMFREDILDVTHVYDSAGTHEYTATTDLLRGTYDLHYNLSTDGAVTQFYVSVLDPDGYEIRSVYGPPAVYTYSTANLTFETQKTGQHIFIFGGRWVSVQVKLSRLIWSTKTTYPYEIMFYAGLPLLISGVIVYVLGALMKEKPAHWLAKP